MLTSQPAYSPKSLDGGCRPVAYRANNMQPGPAAVLIFVCCQDLSVNLKCVSTGHSSMLQGAQSRARGGPFATLNGASAREVLVVHVPANLTVPGPIHVLYLSSGSGSSAAGSTPAAAPRLLAVLEEGSSADIVEEFAALGGSGSGAGSAAAPAVTYLTNAVAEFELDDRAQLKHSYVEVGAGRRAAGQAARELCLFANFQRFANLQAGKHMHSLCVCLFLSAAGGSGRSAHEGHARQPGAPKLLNLCWPAGAVTAVCHTVRCTLCCPHSSAAAARMPSRCSPAMLKSLFLPGPGERGCIPPCSRCGPR